MFSEVFHGHCGEVKEFISDFVSSAKVGSLLNVGQDAVNLVQYLYKHTHTHTISLVVC